MKRMLVLLGLVALVAPMAQGADLGGAVLVEKVLAMQLAEDLGLADAETVDFMIEFNEYAGTAGALKAERGAVAAAVTDGTAGADAVAKLQAIDEKLAGLSKQAFTDLSAGLDDAQKAKLYLFLADLPVLASQAKGMMMGAAPATPPCAAAAATCPAAAGAAAAEASAAAKSDEDLIKETLSNLKAAMEALDVDKVMATFSENFNHPEVGGKEEAKYMIEMGVDMGYADDGEVNMDDMEIEIKGDEATVYPIEASSPAGSVSVEVVLVKEDGKWLISTINPDGL